MNLKEELCAYRNIKKYRNMIDKRNDEIDEMQTVVESLTDSLVKEVKRVSLPYSSKMLQNAYIQQGTEDISMYTFVTEDLKERLFNKEERKLVNFKNILRHGYDFRAYDFYFEYKGFSFVLKIPNVKNANENNLWEIQYGEYQLYHEIELNYLRRITHSYDLDCIADYINSYVNSGW